MLSTFTRFILSVFSRPCLLSLFALGSLLGIEFTDRFTRLYFRRSKIAGELNCDIEVVSNHVFEPKMYWVIALSGV